MDFPFFYQIRGTLFRSPQSKYNLVEIDKVFKNKSPIIAREKVFKYYQNYVDVLLESKGRAFINHEKAVDDLQDFVNSYQHETVDAHKGDIINADFDKGLYIYLIHGDSRTFKTVKGEVVYENKMLIHYFNNKLSDFRGFVFKSLQKEYQLYCENGFNVNDRLMKFNISGNMKLPIYKEVLTTPIDFNKVFEED